jgi:hypothetical protein
MRQNCTRLNSIVKIELDWDCDNGKVHFPMAPYLEKALRKFDNLVPSKRQDQDSSFAHTPPKYSSTTQYAEYDNSPPVGAT